MDVEALKGIFTTLPVDVVASVLFATAITVVTLRTGASISIAFSLALIIATSLFAALPATFLLGSALASIASPYVASAIFVALTILLTYVLYRMTSTLSDDSARPLFAIATGLATTVVVLVVWQMAAPLQSLWSFNGLVQGAFGEAYRLYWIMIAFVAFAFVKS